ncbi:MAG TPA: glycosyltransferase family 9 protein [Acetobacteraceae bacterium]|nr:glycosyltransferase family 9 protein [Acetobacteraceae bacterium]
MKRAKPVQKPGHAPGRHGASASRPGQDVVPPAKPAAARTGRTTRSAAVEAAAKQTAAEPETRPAPNLLPSPPVVDEASYGPVLDDLVMTDEEAGSAHTASPPVLIEIDPAVSGGFIHGRFDVEIHGRVASAAIVEEVELEADGAVLARATFGQPHRAPVITMPDGLEGRHRPFRLTLARPQGRADAPCVCAIHARTSEGLRYTEVFDLAIDPTAPEPVMVRSGATLHSLANTGGRPQIVLYVERALLDSDGNLAVHGWTVAMTPVVTVQVFAGENDRLPAAQLGGQRDDVADFYPTYPNARYSGFTMQAQISQSVRSLGSIRVQAISMHGFSMETVVPVERVALRTPARPPVAEQALEPQGAIVALGPKPNYQLTADFHIAADALGLPVAAMPLPPTPPVVLTNQPSTPKPSRPPQDKRREIHSFCDEALIAPDGTLLVDGWAVCAVGIAGVSVYLGRDKVGEAELGLLRPDVGEAHPHIPMARLSGYRFRRNVLELADLAEGEHGVRVVVRNGLDDVHEETKAVVFERPAPAVAETPSPPPPTAPVEQSEFRFELDGPAVQDDAATEPVTGRLTIEGWVLARSGVASMEIFLDDQRLGEAHYGLARQDVGAAYPDWDNALRSGYAFHCPPRSLRNGPHTVRIVVRARNGQDFVRSFAIEVKKAEDDDGQNTIRRRQTRAETAVLAGVLQDLEYHPHFSLLLRHDRTVPPERVRATLESLARQAYANWDLVVLTDAADVAADLRTQLAGIARTYADRVSVIGPDDAAFDARLAGHAADGPVLAGLLCPGDELGVDALAEIAVAGGLHRDADFLYADEARISPATGEREQFFKPDFSPDLLLSTNYIGRPWFAAAALLHRTGVTPRTLLQDGEYDLVLRCIEQAAAIRHVPKLLVQRGPDVLDADTAGRAALASAAVRRGIDAEVLDGCLPGTWRLKRATPVAGKVAIIIPTCAAQGYIENCIGTLRAHTSYPNYEIICIDNIPEGQMAWKIWLQQHADRVIDIPETFNWSRFNNLAAAATDSDYLLFLNDDIEITQDDWLQGLLEHAQRPEVGIVGPQLLYPSGKVQHAGMFLGAGIGRHAFRFATADDPGYFGLALTQRNVIAVTGACMLMRRTLFFELGGFNEAHSVINNDLDFCLRAHEAGKLTVYTPHVSLMHHELASRERLPDVFDTSHFTTRWKTLFAAGDPYFNPLLSRFSDDYRPDDEAGQRIFAAHPLFLSEDIQRILVVKLDHIGDFVTALPSIRRLKALFPQARITVLAGRHARGFASMEPAIDELLEFEFFHARSQLGEKEVTADDLLALRARLAPYRFDLAVDLRKHLSTRDVLQYTGARYLAGYDYMGQFPFLDIALEWDGDKNLQRKRSHVVDDLLALVEAIATACGTDRNLLPAVAARPEPETLPEMVRPLFEKPVVAMHIGAGNITKTWPAEYFSALIDLLTETNGVNVMLIGGPDDRAASEALLGTLLLPAAVRSVAGLTPLNELPRLLSACCLYIGNDSGPKHIAAALGVPTIGIHSGVVDAVEWAPVGRRAVALQRNMTCSPCYLAKAEDCPRSLACLRHLEPSVVHQAATMFLARPIVEKASAATGELADGAVVAYREDVETRAPLAETRSGDELSPVLVEAGSASGPALDKPAAVVAESESVLVEQVAFVAETVAVAKETGSDVPEPAALARSSAPPVHQKQKPRGRRQRARA